MFEHKTKQNQKWFNCLVQDSLNEFSEPKYYCNFDNSFDFSNVKFFPSGTVNWLHMYGSFSPEELSEINLKQTLLSVLEYAPVNSQLPKKSDVEFTQPTIICGGRVDSETFEKINRQTYFKPVWMITQCHELNDNFVYILPEPEYLGCFYHCAKRGWGMFVITTFIRKMTPEQFLEQIS